ncbi:MAG: TolC family protein, partial [Prevotella sp.]|nr:TolC family protein [Prevotella sp.]
MKNIIFKSFNFLIAVSLLSGCGLYNKYERPEVDTKGLVRDTVSITDTLAVADTTTFGNLPWRSVFTDPQLQALIQQGLDNNPDLLNAALNVHMVNEGLKVAKLAFLPSVALSPQGTLQSFDGAAATKAYTLPVSASWNVDLFGNLLSVKRGAQMQLIATKDYQTVVKCNIISSIA